MSDELIVFGYYTEGYDANAPVAAFRTQDEAQDFAAEFIGRRLGDDLATYIKENDLTLRGLDPKAKLALYEDVYQEFEIREGFWFLPVPVSPSIYGFEHMLLPDETDRCDNCGAALDGGDGYDGLCGDCADRAELEGKSDE
jgi:hypothetical protein